MSEDQRKERIAVYFDPDEKAEVEAAAKKQGVARAVFLRWAALKEARK